MPQSVLFISAMNGDPWGGSEEFWYHLAIWMSQNNYEVSCSYFEWPTGKTERINKLKEAGCKLYPIPNPKLAANPLQKIVIRRKAYKLLKSISSRKWDSVCISQGGYEDVTHRPFRFLHKYFPKFVLIYHNYNESHRVSKSRKRNLNKWICKAALNMGDAARIFEGVKVITGLDVPNPYVLKNPLTIPYQPSVTPWPELENGNYVFTMLAQLDIYRKGQDILIKTLSGDNWVTRPWVLYIYGDGEDKEYLKKLITDKKIGHKIKMMGHTKDVKTVLQKTHLLFQITHIDAMPLSVTEAMNMSRPCIVSPVGDMPLWIKDNVNGYITTEITETAINISLEKAWEERENWEKMGIKAHATFISNYPQPYEKHYSDMLLNL